MDFSLLSLVTYLLLHHAFFSVIIECFYSHGQHICKFLGTKESVCIRKEFNSQRTGLGHQNGHRFIVLGHQYRRDVMWKHSVYSLFLLILLEFVVSNCQSFARPFAA